MPQNIEKSGEQDKEQSKEWKANTDPDCMAKGPFTTDPTFYDPEGESF